MYTHTHIALEYTLDLLHLDASQDLSLGLEDAIGQGIAQHVSQFELRALNKQTACNKKGKERKVKRTKKICIVCCRSCELHTYFHLGRQAQP